MGAIIFRQLYANSGNPWRSRTQGRFPFLKPASRICISRPLRLSTKRDLRLLGRTPELRNGGCIIWISVCLVRWRQFNFKPALFFQNELLLCSTYNLSETPLVDTAGIRRRFMFRQVILISWGAEVFVAVCRFQCYLNANTVSHDC